MQPASPDSFLDPDSPVLALLLLIDDHDAKKHKLLLVHLVAYDAYTHTGEFQIQTLSFQKV